MNKLNDILIKGKLAQTLIISMALVMVGALLGLNVWNDGFSLDLVDLFGIPLVIWLVWYTIARKAPRRPNREKFSGGYAVPPSESPTPPPPVGGSSFKTNTNSDVPHG